MMGFIVAQQLRHYSFFRDPISFRLHQLEQARFSDPLDQINNLLNNCIKYVVFQKLTSRKFSRLGTPMKCVK
jgi:hypothetical protein